MKHKMWQLRLLSSFLLSIIILIISFLSEGKPFINYMNATFIIGFLLLIVSGSYFVIYSGFFTNFGRLMKNIFSKEDPNFDKSHWSYEQSEDELEKKRKIKLEIFLYHPGFIGIILIGQSLILLFFYY